MFLLEWIEAKIIELRGLLVSEIIPLTQQMALQETRLRQELFHRTLWFWASATKLETPQMAVLE